MSTQDMLYGAALSAVLSLVVVAFLARDRRPRVLLTAALAAFLMPLAWNSILRVTGATGAFSHDLPIRPFPISWQDTGSGVFTLAGASVAFALGAATTERPARAVRLALSTALAALLVDIYAY